MTVNQLIVYFIALNRKEKEEFLHLIWNQYPTVYQMGTMGEWERQCFRGPEPHKKSYEAE